MRDAKRVVEIWREAAVDLAIKIETPFELELADGTALSFPVRLPEFGAENGMILLLEFEAIEPYFEEIARLGYGFSTMSAWPDSQYDRNCKVAVLSDWGWAGAEDSKPRWL